MEPYGLPGSPHGDVAIFNGNTTSASNLHWHTWTKPLGKSMASIVVIGGGGGGGSGAIGAASTAAGGGGGGSGAMTTIDMPLILLPPRLYISVGVAMQGAGLTSYVSTWPEAASGNAGHIVAYANGGSVGGNASGATAGALGTAGAASTSGNMPLSWNYVRALTAGVNGAAGGTTSSGGTVNLGSGPRTTGGTGGGGLPASGTGSIGGQINGQVAVFPIYLGGVGPTAATTPANRGSDGFSIRDAGLYFYGGTGGSSTFATATGAGLVQARGGNGAIGSGGGGSGGALTGSTAAAPSYGGAGLVIITCY